MATGGCFDLLHPGHLRTLEAAHDRARLLLGLSCVDAITVFDEDTPVVVLGTIRPQVFVKGGDYVGMEIAEADALATWGGRVVVLPLVDGRSTTRMIDAARRPA